MASISTARHFAVISLSYVGVIASRKTTPFLLSTGDLKIAVTEKIEFSERKNWR